MMGFLATEFGIPKFLYSLELFSGEDLFLGNLGIKEFVLWRDFISTDLGDYRIFSHWSGGIRGIGMEGDS